MLAVFLVVTLTAASASACSSKNANPKVTDDKKLQEDYYNELGNRLLDSIDNNGFDNGLFDNGLFDNGLFDNGMFDNGCDNGCDDGLLGDDWDNGWLGDN
jgi:hypothetical protein